jgi:hypothetical protein
MIPSSSHPREIAGALGNWKCDNSPPPLYGSCRVFVVRGGPDLLSTLYLQSHLSYSKRLMAGLSNRVLHPDLDQLNPIMGRRMWMKGGRLCGWVRVHLFSPCISIHPLWYHLRFSLFDQRRRWGRTFLLPPVIVTFTNRRV